jgi:hypothetical protein
VATQADFKSLADSLINGTFSDFRQTCVFELLGSYDPVTETNAASATNTIKCIRLEFNAMQKNNSVIQRDDFMLLAEFDKFTNLSPRTDGVIVTIQGVANSIVSTELDPANAVYTIHVRAS